MMEDDPGDSISQMDLPDAINDPEQIKAFIVWNSNPVASNPAQEKIIRGLSREDLFTVVVDCFPTDTAMYADIILPAASFLEFDDLCASYFQLTLGAQVKVTGTTWRSLTQPGNISQACGRHEAARR